MPVGSILCRISATAPRRLRRPGRSRRGGHAPRSRPPAPGSAAVDAGGATPVAARMASAHGIDVGALRGSGPRGRVTKEDVLAAVEGNGAATPAPPRRDGARRRRDGAHQGPGGHPRPVHGREPLHPHGHQLPHPARGRAGRAPQGAEGGGEEALLHPPDRLGDRAGRPRLAGDGQLLRRAGRQAPARPGGNAQPGPGRGHGAQGREPLVGGARDPRRLGARLRHLCRPLRRAGGRRARQQAAPGRLPGRQHLAHQPRRPRHRGLRAPPDAGPGHDHRHRRHRLPAGAHRGGSGAAPRARRAEGHHDDQHLRPPRHPGRGVGILPPPHRRAAPGGRRLLRGRVRRARAGGKGRGLAGDGARHGGRAGALHDHARRLRVRGRGAAPGRAGRHLAGQGAPHARPPGRGPGPARLRAGGRSRRSTPRAWPSRPI